MVTNRSFRTHADARRSAYTDPVAVAAWLVANEQPLPVDLQDDLESMGYIVPEFLESLGQQENSGFSIN